MSLRIYTDLVQGTPEWHDARRGIITASTVGQLITMRKLGAIDYDCPDCTGVQGGPCMSVRGSEPKPIKTMHPARAEYARTQPSSTVIEPASNDTSRGLTAALAAERISGYTEPTYVNEDMQRGIDCEPIARDLYSQHYELATEVGFMVRTLDGGHRLGYSPDGLVGDDGLVEIKCPRQKGHIQTIVSGAVPAEHMAQLQAGLLVSGRKWIDYVSYCGGLPLYVRRVYPDPRWQQAITQAVRLFEDNAAEMGRIFWEASEGLQPTERIEVIDLIGVG